MAKDLNTAQRQMRERIAQAAARLIAEEGIQDYALAKRKACRQIGVPATHSLPANSEIEDALRAHQAIFQKEEQQARLELLLQAALKAMRLLARFAPHLTGAVLGGTAPRHSDIKLHLFADSAKDVELFLLNHQLPYRSGERKFRYGEEFRHIPVFTLPMQPAEVELAVFAADGIRSAPKNPATGKPMARATTGQVELQLAALQASPPPVFGTAASLDAGFRSE